MANDDGESLKLCLSPAIFLFIGSLAERIVMTPKKKTGKSTCLAMERRKVEVILDKSELLILFSSLF